MNGIELKGVSARLGTFELKEINLEVPKGSILGVLGRNGAGKTTLFKTINGTYLKTEGLLRVNGVTYEEDEKAIRDTLAIVYDVYNVNPFTKGRRLKKYHRIWHARFDETMFDGLINRFGIDLNKHIQKLSLGMQKKLLLSLALSIRPKVLLLDEPMIGIDPVDKQMMFEQIQGYMEDESNTLVISSHYVEDIERIADHIAIIDGGRILHVANKESLLDAYVYVNVDHESDVCKDIIHPIKKSFGTEGIMKSEIAKRHGIESKRATLEQIFIHLSQAEVV
ncbi:MAG: ABC transporter ATP-binding protein [Acholeplasmataceae bacterium]|nr:ABC transporter ATP-binding protein [Acholeplasmataceae bacterium]